jgi:hypothetical protein
VTGTAQRETPNVGIFWLAQTTDGEARLLASGCPLDQAELYGDCLTYGPGRYETWAEWRGDRTVDPALRAIVRSYEYEDWPRGRIFFDRARDLLVLYADRKLMTPEMIVHIETQFHLPAERTEIHSDIHYQSTETPNVLATRATRRRRSVESERLSGPTISNELVWHRRNPVLGEGRVHC